MPEAVLVTEKEFAKAEGVFCSQGEFTVHSVCADERLLAEALLAKNCRAVIVGVDRYAGPLYEALGKAAKEAGGIIARFGVGHDGIDKDLARQQKIVVTNTPGVLDISVAEHAVWLMGCLARHVSEADARVKAGRFEGRTGRELRGKTLAVVGFGAIGKRVARMARFGLGMKVLAADRLAVGQLLEREGKSFEEIKADSGISEYSNDLDAVLGESDVVSVHLPGGSQMLKFFDGRRFSTFKGGALFVNTARGSLVDEDALYEALRSGQVGGAGLDVFINEPYEPTSADKDLRKLDNVLLTPHLASDTTEVNERMARACLENITNFFTGRLGELSRVS